MEFLKENLGTIVVALAVAGIIAAVIISMRKNKKKGKSACGCGCGCEGCASKGMCHGDDTKEKE